MMMRLLRDQLRIGFFQVLGRAQGGPLILDRNYEKIGMHDMFFFSVNLVQFIFFLF